MNQIREILILVSNWEYVRKRSKSQMFNDIASEECHWLYVLYYI